jgi:hypothetical protein
MGQAFAAQQACFGERDDDALEHKYHHSSNQAVRALPGTWSDRPVVSAKQARRLDDHPRSSFSVSNATRRRYGDCDGDGDGEGKGDGDGERDSLARSGLVTSVSIAGGTSSRSSRSPGWETRSSRSRSGSRRRREPSDPHLVLAGGPSPAAAGSASHPRKPRRNVKRRGGFGDVIAFDEARVAAARAAVARAGTARDGADGRALTPRGSGGRSTADVYVVDRTYIGGRERRVQGAGGAGHWRANDGSFFKWAGGVKGRGEI